MEEAQQPSKRMRMTLPIDPSRSLDTNADFVKLGELDDVPESAPSQVIAKGPSHISDDYSRRIRYDPRHRLDRPKTKHALPGVENWILVKTRLGRRFVHNRKTNQSLWRIPQDLLNAVAAFDLDEEKQRNMAWSEEQFKMMQEQQKLKANEAAQDPARRRRSISLQREDEEAMMAELAAQAQHAEEQDAREAVEAVASLEPRGYLGEASDSEYEYVEVTDTEGEGEDEGDEQAGVSEPDEDHVSNMNKPGPVNFGEDDIAYQLAMMGEQYGLDPEEYEQPEDEDVEYDDEDDIGPNEEEAVALFHQMLDEYAVSPYTPWDNVIADASSSSIVFDQRYTVLPSSRARKDAWESWSRDRAAQLKAARALEEKRDPRIAYLEFLGQYASTKLYWPEFKRKYKRESVMNDRSLQDKDRERYYRELMTKLKLSEAKRNEELRALLKTIPTGTYPSSKIMTNVLLYSVAKEQRDLALQPFLT